MVARRRTLVKLRIDSLTPFPASILFVRPLEFSASLRIQSEKRLARRRVRRRAEPPGRQGLLRRGFDDSGRWPGRGRDGGRTRLGSDRYGRRRRGSRATVGECGCGASGNFARITQNGRWCRSDAYIPSQATASASSSSAASSTSSPASPTQFNEEP